MHSIHDCHLTHGENSASKAISSSLLRFIKNLSVGSALPKNCCTKYGTSLNPFTVVVALRARYPRCTLSLGGALGAKAHVGAVNDNNTTYKKCEGWGLKQASFGLPGEGKKRRWCGGCAKAQK